MKWTVVKWTVVKWTVVKRTLAKRTLAKWTVDLQFLPSFNKSRCKKIFCLVEEKLSQRDLFVFGLLKDELLQKDV